MIWDCSDPPIARYHGPYRFDIMNRIIYKSYQNLTNILLRISSSHEESKTLAILLNSHLDSTLPSPGAADDALAVAISLEVARVLIEAAGKGEWEVGWGIVIC
jgi:Zn-dependent M28 family amino/carboxypeptidase